MRGTVTIFVLVMQLQDEASIITTMKIIQFFSPFHHLYFKFINYFNIPTSKFDPTSPNIAQYTLIYYAYRIHRLGCYLFILQGFLTTKRLYLAQLHISIQLIKELIMNLIS